MLQQTWCRTKEVYKRTNIISCFSVCKLGDCLVVQAHRPAEDEFSKYLGFCCPTMGWAAILSEKQSGPGRLVVVLANLVVVRVHPVDRPLPVASSSTNHPADC